MTNAITPISTGVSSISDVPGLQSALTAVDTKAGYRMDARTIGVLRTNTAAANKTALQNWMDTAAASGVNIEINFAEPVPMAGGLILRKGVKWRGNNLASFKGSPPDGGGTAGLTATPSGAAFLITDTTNVFVKMESATGIEGMIFHYPSQAFNGANLAACTTYPDTIQKATGVVSSISLRRLCFVGATTFMNLGADATNYLADVEVDACYGYPLGGYFLALSYCLDIPRVTRNHVNPGAGVNFLGQRDASYFIAYSTSLIDSMCASGSASFVIDNTDEFVAAQNFCFGVKTAYKTVNSYGQFTNCTADEVETGYDIYLGSGNAHKYVNIFGGNIIASAGPTPANRNGVKFSGTGGTLRLYGVHSFLGTNGAVPSSSNSNANALVLINGSGAQRVDIVSCFSVAMSGGGAYANGDIQSTNTSATVNQFPGSGAAAPTTTVHNRSLFTASDGTTLASYTPDLGGAWTVLAGTWSVSSNELGLSATGSDDIGAGAVFDSLASDLTMTATLKVSAGGAGLIIRESDINNHLLFSVEPHTDASGTYDLRWYARNGGSYTLLSNSTVSGLPGLGAALSVSVTASGSNLSGRIVGASALVATSSFNSTATKCGVRAAGATSAKFDNVEVSY